MEFHEKLQELRKNKGLTQEELAAELYVSRTAISKWESGRGYPSIDSLKQIAGYFDVSVDALLSGDVLVTIAEKEYQSKLRRVIVMLVGMTDVFAFMMIVLPLYPNDIGGYVCAVNLLEYTPIVSAITVLYWGLLIGLIAIGFSEVILIKHGDCKHSKIMAEISIVVNIMIVVLFVISRVIYAALLAFVILIIKSFLLLKLIKSNLVLKRDL